VRRKRMAVSKRKNEASKGVQRRGAPPNYFQTVVIRSQQNQRTSVVYDTQESDGTGGTGVWHGPWLVDNDDTWPGCIGSPLDAGTVGNANVVADNDVRPRLAVESHSVDLWVAYIHSTPHLGTRTKIAAETLVCTGGVLQPATGGSAWVAPDPCYINPNSGGCPSNADGGNWKNACDGGCYAPTTNGDRPSLIV
jgi:hypothetical protein